MATLQGLGICCLSAQAKLTGTYVLPIVSPLKKIKLHNGAFWGHRGSTIIDCHKQSSKGNKDVQCSFSSSSDGDGIMEENFSENDEEYVNSSVIEAGI